MQYHCMDMVYIIHRSTNSFWPYVMHPKWYKSAHFLKLSYQTISSSSCGWNHLKLAQRMPRHYVFVNYNLDQPNPMSVAGGTAASAAFDGPSVPSFCCGSCCSPPKGLLFVYFCSICLLLRCHNTFFSLKKTFTFSKRQEETPKEKSLGFGLHLEHFHP